jgi:hypothetical protein
MAVRIVFPTAIFYFGGVQPSTNVAAWSGYPLQVLDPFAKATASPGFALLSLTREKIRFVKFITFCYKLLDIKYSLAISIKNNKFAKK